MIYSKKYPQKRILKRYIEKNVFFLPFDPLYPLPVLIGLAWTQDSLPHLFGQHFSLKEHW